MEIVPIPTDTYTLGFIGAGKMAESIAGGAVRSGVLPSSRIRTAHSNPSRRTAFESIGVTVLSSNEDVVRESNIVVFSVKPQVVKDVVLKLRPLLTKNKLLVSVAAGVKLKDLQEWAAHDRFIRVMPNTPAAIGEAASVMSLGGAATEEDGNIIAKLFGSVGKIWKADEKFFDAITGLSGSGPAYIYLAIEALADGGVAAGLPRDLSLSLASQTVGQVTSRINLSRLVYIGPIQCIVEKSDIALMHPNCVDASLDLDHNFFQVLGAASMVTQTKKHPGQLKDDVTSPGGTTIAGVHELEKGGFRAILMNAVVAAAKRSRELS